MNQKRLAERVALVTGGGRGIGRATALALADAGAWVVPVARTAADVEGVAKEARERAGRALPLVADVTAEPQVRALVERVLEEFGRVDLLVNNVGQGLRKPFLETERSDWERVWSLNLWSAVLCVRTCLEPMLAQGGGQIVNVASRAGRRGEAEMVAYSAAKAGLIALTQGLAEELEGRVRVNAVAPGPVSTERMRHIAPGAPHERWLTPEEVAAAVLYLATSTSPALNGVVLDLF